MKKTPSRVGRRGVSRYKKDELRRYAKSDDRHLRRLALAERCFPGSSDEEKTPFARVPSWLVFDGTLARLHAVDGLVLLALAGTASNRSSVACPTTAMIARMTGVTKSGIPASIRRLVEAGVIEKVRFGNRQAYHLRQTCGRLAPSRVRQNSAMSQNEIQDQTTVLARMTSLKADFGKTERADFGKTEQLEERCPF